MREDIAILITVPSTGLRLGDMLSIKLSLMLGSEKCYRLKIQEKKTGKERDVALLIYAKTDNDIVAVQQALLHSSLAVTRRYLNRRSEKLN